MSKLALVLVAMATAIATFAPAASAHACDTPWGSLAESDADYAAATLVDVRAGQHRCFDRLVFELDGQVEGYDIRYVKRFRSDGSGDVIGLRGRAQLAVTVRAPAYDDDGKATFAPADRSEVVEVAGFRTFRQVAWGASFEGQTSVGLGVRARLPFRVFTLGGAGDHTRLVVDVAHGW